MERPAGIRVSLDARRSLWVAVKKFGHLIVFRKVALSPLTFS